MGEVSWTELELVHYTEEPLVYDSSRTYLQGVPHGFGKPHGLWVSVAGEDDWPEWCRREEYFLDGLANAVRVTLDPNAEILHIKTGPELVAFHGAYCAQSEFDRIYHPDDKGWWGIDWGVVTAGFDGVIIAPYLWSYRLSREVNWYYSWDVASGCIWNLDAIEKVEKIDTRDRKMGTDTRISRL